MPKRRIKTITIVILGAVVGMLIYSIYAPVFSLGDALPVAL